MEVDPGIGDHRPDFAPEELGVPSASQSVGTDSDFPAEKIIEWRLQECIETGRKIDNYVRLDATLLSIALSLFAAAIGLALAHGYHELLLGLPLAFSLYFCLMQYFHGEFLGLAGYKSALEKQITKDVRVPVVFWESSLAPSHHHAKTPVLTWIVMGAVYTAGSIAAIIESFKFVDDGGWPQRHSELLIGLTVGSVVAGLLLCLLADAFARSEFGRVERDAEAVLAVAPALSIAEVALQAKDATRPDLAEELNEGPD